MRYRLLIGKRWAEDVLMYPLILLGRLIAKQKPLRKEYETFFFFPFYHTGGAEKVHAAVAKATGNANCIIFFTRKSLNNDFYHLFTESGCTLKDISRYTDNKWLYPVNIVFRGILSGYINGQQKVPLVFNGQCNFGYKISPWIKSSVPQIELIHSVSNFSYIRLPFLPFITRTVMISTVKIKEHLAIYKRYGVPQHAKDRIEFVMNGIDLPTPLPPPKQPGNGLTVLYVGRGTPEKRVHLVGEIASRVAAEVSSVRFQFLGDVQDAVPAAYHPLCQFFGNQKDETIIHEIYSNADVLLLVSDTEGFPMVIMEAMARGLAVVSTAVGEVPLHVHNGISGFVIADYRNEQAVVSSAAEYIMRFLADPALLRSVSAHNINYAANHFGMDRFAEQYRDLFSKCRRSKGKP